VVFSRFWHILQDGYGASSQKILESPRKAYFNVSGKSLSSNLRGSMIDGIGIDVDTGKGSTLDFH